MVATFLDDNRPKTLLEKRIRSVANFIDLIQFHLVCQMLRNVLGLNPKGPYLSLEEKKDHFCVCVVFTYSIKRAHEINRFHVAVVQRRLRNVQKSVVLCKVVVLLK